MTEQVISGAVPAWRPVDRLRRAREYAELDQTQLADRIGVSRHSISNYERGAFAPRRPVLLSWALATGVALDWLTGGSPDGDVASPHRGAQVSSHRGSRDGAGEPTCSYGEEAA
jgi:transcriptional regulator with XRE-family HTH domain